MLADLLIKILHGVPHLSFSFRLINEPFSLQLDSEYIQTVLLYAFICLFIGGLLLSVIIITWICQCCNNRKNSAKSRRRVRQLSLVLFSISVFCFFFLGFCLFGNEHVNRGVTTAIQSTNDVTANLKLATIQCNSLNESQVNLKEHLNSLMKVVKEKSKDFSDKDKEQINNIEKKLDFSYEKLTSIGVQLAHLKGILQYGTNLNQLKLYAERIELERWILFVTLLSIMLIVLFAGVIGFCRQSKKGAVVFSGLGFAIFIFGWLLLSFVFPATVMLADFCATGDSFIRTKLLRNETMDLLLFYKYCTPRPTHDNIPELSGVDNLSQKFLEVQQSERNIDLSLKKLFNSTPEISSILERINDDMVDSLRDVGGIEATIACYAYHENVNSMVKGFCNDGIIGATVIAVSLVFLGFFLFALLLIVSKSWHLFARLPSDYVEVDADDPFSPRGNDNSIPVDIYGTHIYNPRTRFANSLERMEPSTGATTITGGIPNGSATNHTASMLESAGPSTPLWQRGTMTTASVSNAPPAYVAYGVSDRLG